MLLYIAQCEDTVGGPLNNDTVPYPLRDWVPKVTAKSSIVASKTATSSADTSTVTSTPTSLSLHEPSSFSSASATQEDSKSILSIAAIVGIAVGGTAVLFLIIGSVAFFLQRRKHRRLSTTIPPPNYEVNDSKEGYDVTSKPELDGQVLAYQPFTAGSSVIITTPVDYVELDGDGAAVSPVSPIGEPVGRS